MHFRALLLSTLLFTVGLAEAQSAKSAQASPSAKQVAECRDRIAAYSGFASDRSMKSAEDLAESHTGDELGTDYRKITDCVEAHWSALTKNDLANAVKVVGLLSYAISLISVKEALAPKGKKQGDATITLGIVTLKLGMAKDTVLAQLAGQFDLKQAQVPNSVSGTSVWAVLKKNSATVNDPYGTVLGTVQFADNRLTFVEKKWNAEVPATAAAMTNAIYGAVSDLKSRGSLDSCLLAVGEVTDPDSEQKATTIQCGHNEIHISVMRVNGHEYAMIDESLE